MEGKVSIGVGYGIGYGMWDVECGERKWKKGMGMEVWVCVSGKRGKRCQSQNFERTRDDCDFVLLCSKVFAFE